MSRVKVETVIPARVSVTYQVTCSLCKRGALGRTRSDGPVDWSSGPYEVSTTHIELVEGSSYPEGGSAEHTAVDICPRCFKERLVAWLKQQGVTVHQWLVET